MLDFADRCRGCAALPRATSPWRLPRDQVLACAVRLLDQGFFRIGGEEYAEGNEPSAWRRC